MRAVAVRNAAPRGREVRFARLLLGYVEGISYLMVLMAILSTDCLRHSRSRINAYKALCSPSLIAVRYVAGRTRHQPPGARRAHTANYFLLLSISPIYHSLMKLSSKDPILTAFDLSWRLRRLSVLEPEFKSEYLELRKQCQTFATTLLDHTRTSTELEVRVASGYMISNILHI